MRRVIVALIIAALGCTAPQARAAFTGLSIQSFPTTLNGSPRTIHRLWADFTSPTDGVTSWGAVGTPLTIQNIQANGQLSANGFFNSGGNGDLPPPGGNPLGLLDSFYTINLFEFSPLLFNNNMPPITDGVVTLFAPMNTASISTSPDNPWAYAGYWGGPPRVALMAALVTGGEHIRGTIGLNTIGSEAVIVATFNSAPGPGALAVMALAGALGTRRRR